MKFLVVGDVHWCKTSSIVRSVGETYSTRLENLIKSVNWAEEMADRKQADKVIYLGDFFDRTDIDAEEGSALSEIAWSEKPHIFICGNHESSTADHRFNLLNLFSRIGEVITKPTYDADIKSILYLPYLQDDNRPSLDTFNADVIFSHNDIEGINYGAYVSKTGYNIDSIKQNCKRFINGHIHNGTDNGVLVNVGNLTGQNFCEDAKLYPHRVLLFDCNTLEYESIENPYAFNFYKIKAEDTYIPSILNMKDNMVLTVSCSDKEEETVRSNLRDCSAIVESRLIVTRTKRNTDKNKTVDKTQSFDHIVKFVEYALENTDDKETAQEEISEMFGGIG